MILYILRSDSRHLDMMLGWLMILIIFTLFKIVKKAMKGKTFEEGDKK
jgi:hypothetical protein